MHVIYLLLNLCFNINIKFKLYSNYIIIMYIIIEYLFININQYVYNQLDS